LAERYQSEQISTSLFLDFSKAFDP